MKYKIQELTQKNLQKIWEGNFPRCNFTTEQIKYNFELKLFQYASGRVYDGGFSKEVISIYRQEEGEADAAMKSAGLDLYSLFFPCFLLC